MTAGTDGITAANLRHEGVPYTGHAAFVPSAAQFLSDGNRQGEACLMLAEPDKIDAVRTELGSDARSVTFVDMSLHGRNPSRVLPAMQSFVDTHAARRVRVLAEPVHAGLSPAARSEVSLAELVLRRPEYRRWSGWLCCFYDESALDASAVASIRADHEPEAPDGVLAQRFTTELPAAPRSGDTIGADRTNLGVLRRMVSSFALRSGLDPERTDDLVYAVNEVVTNSICHGEGRAAVRLWTEGRSVLCDVRDRGRIRNPLVGRVAPRAGQESGRGLWLVNQLCDLVQIRSPESGTVVRMRVDL